MKPWDSNTWAFMASLNATIAIWMAASGILGILNGEAINAWIYAYAVISVATLAVSGYGTVQAVKLEREVEA